MKDIQYILNDCLNKAMCQKERIQNPDSNNIADFVSKYLQTEKLTLTNVVERSEQLVCPECKSKHIDYKPEEYYECSSCDHTWAN